MIAPKTPQNVKDAWMEASKEVNANGLGIKENGMLSHISQMMVQRLNKPGKAEKVIIFFKIERAAWLWLTERLQNI